MFYTLANTGSVGVNVVDSDLPALSDPQVTIQNNHFLLGMDSYLLGAWYGEASALRCKMDSPKLRGIYLPYIRPVDRSATPPQRANYVDYSGYELLLRKAEEIKFLVSNNLGAATEQAYVITWFGDKTRTSPQGPAYTMRTTATITALLNAWTAGAITFDQTLPAGLWSVVGMEVFGTGLIAARLVFPAYPWRPGVLAGQDAGKFMGPQFRFGNMGEFGRFYNTALPQLEILCNAAGAVTVEAYLDLIQVG